jgi:HD-GYP domain-containing protein (c-di-GMP phosphodiesterase class II)
MTSDRVYRRAKTSQDALDELEKNAGTQFDPEIVDAVCRVIAAGRPVFSGVDEVRAVLASAPLASSRKPRNAPV